MPELQPFVRVSPETIANITAGLSVPVEITVTSPPTTLPQTVNGTIQVRAVNGNGSTIAKPLPVSLAIVWKTYSNVQAGVQMSYPDFGIASKVDVLSTDSGEMRLDVSFQPTGNTNFISGFGVFLMQNSNHLSLSDWFRQNIDPQGTLMSSGVFTPTKLINGMSVLVLTGPLPSGYLDEQGPVNSIYGISPSGNTIVSIAQSQVNGFDLYGLTPDQVRQMLLEVAANLQAP